MTDSATHFDVVIVGGGLVGATTAIALAPLGLKIAVIEPFAIDSNQQPSFDDRSVALSFGSAQILNEFGIWEFLSSHAFPISNIHVSDKSHFGMCRLSAAEFDKSALGYVVENRSVGLVLKQCFERHNNISIISSYAVTKVEQLEDNCSLFLESKKLSTESDQYVQQHDQATPYTKQVSAKLVIAADGTNSSIANLLNIKKQRFDYPNTAAICNIATERKPDGWAYERFTEAGPIALLPLVRNRYSVVWSIKSDSKHDIQSLTDNEFIAELQKCFGHRAGKITRVGERSCYPLQSQLLDQYYSNRIIFVGNALHTGHPVAGQGFNLGLRDVALITELVAIAAHYDCDLGSPALRDLYQTNREIDIIQTLSMTDLLARGFSQTNKVVAVMRNIMLQGLDNVSLLKQVFANHAMGLRHDLPFLARGGKLKECYRQPLAFTFLDRAERQLSSVNK
ncbi:MAG: 2-octaprenyl-6-methoxyphenyl hydroxylase [Gammaproteobacteria bacterium]|nr:2-octaprenyl-6-methoxyphenyl hydroxylase [Gammaproteobacteria bacterium]